MNVRHPMGVLHSLSIKYFYDNGLNDELLLNPITPSAVSTKRSNK